MQHCILLTLLHLSTSYCTFFFLFNSISYQKFPCIQIGNISKIQRSIDTRFQQLPHCFTLMFTTSCSSSNVSLPFFCIVCCYPSKNRISHHFVRYTFFRLVLWIMRWLSIKISRKFQSTENCITPTQTQTNGGGCVGCEDDPYIVYIILLLLLCACITFCSKIISNRHQI